MFDFHQHQPLPAPAALPPVAGAAGIETDADLLALREPLLIAWRAEAAAWAIVNASIGRNPSWARAEAANDRTRVIVDRIEALPATTVQGLCVKALALSWTHSGEALDADADADWNKTTDMRLIAQIVRRLVDMAGGREGSYPQMATLYGAGGADV